MKRTPLFILIGAAAVALTTAISVPAAAVEVSAGWDLLQTTPGTYFNFPSIGQVDLIGQPTGPGNTDTIVRRLADADISGGPATIPIELVSLSLQSAQPVPVGSSFFDVFVGLDPANPSTGQMTIQGTSSGGTFDSFFDVFFEATFTDTTNPANVFHVFGDLPLSSTNTPWVPDPPSGAVIVPGVYPDLSANLHSGLPAGFVDFFPVGPFQEVKPGVGEHDVTLATPEPASFLLAGLGLAVIGRRRRRET